MLTITQQSALAVASGPAAGQLLSLDTGSGQLVAAAANAFGMVQAASLSAQNYVQFNVGDMVVAAPAGYVL